MENKYIKVNDLNIKQDSESENYDELLEKDGFPVYQLQPIKNTNNCILMEIGRFVNFPNIMITQFNLDNKVKCIIISPLFTKKSIKSYNNDYLFEQKEILINKIDDNKQIASMKIIFNSSINKNINKYLSNNQKKINIKGSYSILFYYGSSALKLEEFEYFKTDINMIEKMLYHLSTDKIKNIINNLIKK